MDHSQIIFSHKVFVCFFLCLFLFRFARVTEASANNPVDVLKLFISEVNKGEYKKAYRLFSEPLKERITYGDFHEGAKQAKDIQFVSAKVLSQDSRVAKARVTLTDLEKYQDHEGWHRKRYSGEVVFLREKGEWHFIQVEFRFKREGKSLKGGHYGK